MGNLRELARERVWRELRKVARPDSRFHFDFKEFIADYENSHLGTERITQLAVYKNGQNIFVTPDNNLTDLRAAAIADNKTVIMPTYGIVRGFLVIGREDVPEGQEAFAATLDGMDHFARPIHLDEIVDLSSLDLMVTGASVISLNGVRFGKGHGFFDLEWAVMCTIGVVDGNTPVVAVVHDCQVINMELEAEPHDTAVDYIITPTRSIKVKTAHPKPTGIYWDILPTEVRETIPPLQELYQREKTRGGDRREDIRPNFIQHHKRFSEETIEEERKMTEMTQKKSTRYSTTALLTTAVVAVIGGIVSAYAVLPWAKFIEGVLGPWGAALDNGFFTIWYIIIGLLTGLPGLTFIGGMLTGTVEVLAGSIDGPIVWVFVFFQALAAEIGFFVRRYRPDLFTSLLAGGLSGIGAGIPFIIIYGFSGLPTALNVVLFVALFIGNMILAGLLGYGIYRAVARTGVTGEAGELSSV